MSDTNEKKRGKGGSNQYCAVPGCRTLRRREPEVSFFRFPQEGKGTVRIMSEFGLEESVDRFKVWKGVLGVKQISKSTVICSKHFLISDYILYDPKMKKPRLKSIAVPSQNLHNPSARKTQRIPLAHEEEQCHEHEEYEIFTANACFLEKHNLSPSKEASLSSLIVDNAQLNTLTGLHNLQFLDNLVEAFDRHEESSISTLPTPPATRDRIVLTFIKLKHSSSFSTLSKFFNISATSCRKHFLRTISVLAEVLSPAVSWPKNIQKKNIPSYFEDFLNVKVLLDRVEINIQPKNCAICTSPKSSSRETLKVITGISPESLIIFISRCASNIPDKKLFEDNTQALLNNLGIFDDCFMADRGFSIDSVAEKHNIKLLRPEMFEISQQFTETQRNYNVNVIKIKNHCERINSRFRIFSILCDFPKSLLSVFDEVFRVVCAVVNLQSRLGNRIEL